MKIRNGFVSNSSSSSFVILGVAAAEELENTIRMSNGKVIQSLYVEGKTDYINGYVIADGGDYDFDESETGDISGLIKEIAQLLEVDEKEVKLITGTRPC